ncbi:hypothetical protein A3Q56_01967 [Intoshia linei]|uniref:Uncharacterized protein n=1 Tax=Intoshia linei TaxID=1819745 RepID=A0A177B871_9BILA|nr:hypothetical protein A3Q56_01967 [Intoshia linei]
MIWEVDTKSIVMLTKYSEKGRQCCEQYYPIDDETITSDDISITVVDKTIYNDYTVSELKLLRGEEERRIKHFFYSCWPDFGIPKECKSLIEFIDIFREKMSYDTAPHVVHCRAGVGRSGAFIALDRSLQQVKKLNKVNIFGIVSELRYNRVSMVQTEHQYICIHECVLDVINKKLKTEQIKSLPYQLLEDAEVPLDNDADSVKPEYVNQTY